MAVILVPKPPKRAFNKNRPPSTLLRSQIEHLEWAARSKFGEKTVPRRGRRVRTEGEAADYIEDLTRRLHPEGAAPPAGPAPATKRRRKEGVRPRTAHKRGSVDRKGRANRRSGARGGTPRRRTR